MTPVEPVRTSLRPTPMTLASQLRSPVLAVVLGLLLLGCGSSGQSSDAAGSVDPADTGQVTYVVTGVTEGGQARSLVPGSEIRVVLDQGRIGISAGCNSIGGEYRLEGTRLTVTDLASTEMGCDQPLMEQDAWVAGLFASPVTFTTGDDAAIISGDVVLALVDREQVSPDLPLEGTRWVLDTLIDGEIASSVPAGAEAFLVIEGSRISLKDGCNTGSGQIEIGEGTLVVDQTTRTRMACRGTEEVEGAFTAVLDGAAEYVIEETRLTITHDGRGLGFTGTPAGSPSPAP